MIDTLKLSKGLRTAGMTEAQAEGIAEALADAQTDYVTKTDLRAALAELETRLNKTINDAKFQILLAIGLLVLAQIGLHFWH
jgi:hypothetical protein